MESLSKIIFFFIICWNLKTIKAVENNFIKILEESFNDKLSEFSNYIVSSLEGFNDRHLGNTELGRMIRYEELKSKTIVEPSRKGKSMKKMGMAMMPLVFHVGATSTWMLLTSIMAVKSVVIGLVLLVFKIAVSSAKVASFFTALKAKHSHHDHSWSSPSEHQGFERSLPDFVYHAVDWSSYTPEISHVSPYKTIPMYKNHAAIEDEDFSEETKTHS